MDFLADGIAFAALVITVVSYTQSRAKARQAEASAAAAAENAAQSREALQRVADETREANTIARSILPPSPWDISVDLGTVSLRNQSMDELLNVTVRQKNGDDLTPLDDRDVEQRQVLLPNQRVLLGYAKTLDSPAGADLEIKWRTSTDGPIQTWYETLS